MAAGQVLLVMLLALGLGALLNNGRRGILIAGLESREYAAFLGKKIETHLGIRHAADVRERTSPSLETGSLGLTAIPEGTAREV